jgi:hypothetical protein
VDKRTIARYLDEIPIQCEFAMLAVGVLNNQFDREMQSKPDRVIVFFALQAILNHAANVSKLIWGAPGKSAHQQWRAERITALPSVLGLDNTSPLHSRDMRNNLEHFDDRLDIWANAAAGRGTPIDMKIGRVGGFHASDLPPEVYFRQYDHLQKIMRFFNEEIDMQALVTELTRVAALAKQISERLKNEIREDSRRRYFETGTTDR